MANRRHFPTGWRDQSTSAQPYHGVGGLLSLCDLLKNTYYAGLRLVIDKIVDLVIAMDQCASILRLGFWISEELHHIFVVRSLAYWGLGLDIHRLGLGRRDCAECLDLAVVETRRLTKAREADRGRRNAVKLCKRRDSILPPVHGENGKNQWDSLAHIWFLSLALTPGNDASSNMRPFRNSMI